MERKSNMIDRTKSQRKDTLSSFKQNEKRKQNGNLSIIAPNFLPFYPKLLFDDFIPWKKRNKVLPTFLTKMYRIFHSTLFFKQKKLNEARVIKK